MDSECEPRFNPPPKPTELQVEHHKPEVPEVSLMFDTDDSLIWQRPGFKKNGNGRNSSPNLQKETAKSSHHPMNNPSSKGTPPIGQISGLSEKENSPNLFRGFENSSRENRSVGNTVEQSPKFQDSFENVLSTARPKKQYNPMHYSPSSRILEKNNSDSEARNNLVKHTNLPALNSDNVRKSPLIGNDFSVGADGVPIYSKCVSGVNKAVRFDKEAMSSPEPVTRLEFIPTLTSSNQRESYNVLGFPNASQSELAASNTRPAIRPNIRFANALQEPYKSSLHCYKDSQFANVPKTIGQTNTLAVGDVHQSYSQPYCAPPYQPPPVTRNPEPINLNVYQLLEDQNRQIMKLYETLETFLKKGSEGSKDSVNGEMENTKKDSPVSQKIPVQASNCSYRDASTQTIPSNNANLQSVGTNTDISWPDLLSAVKNRELPSSHHASPRLNAAQRQINDEELQAAKECFQNSRHQRVSELRKSGSERKEISFTMREVVMASIQEYQPSPEPSLHINMEDYKDESQYEVYDEDSRVSDGAGACVSSPDLGGRVNASDREDSPYPKYERNRENRNVPSSGNPPTNTFYNNVMANIQQILQNSRSGDDEEEEEHSRRQNVHDRAEEQENPQHRQDMLDPQVEAIRHQLSQFGVSCIDPASLVPGRRHMSDTLGLPGLHNMLSVYQSTIVSPYRSGLKDSVVAKYITDMQLAAIASRSTAMRNQNVNATGVRERELPAVYNPSSLGGAPDYLSSGKEYSCYDDNLSMATKNFLGKYGLGGNE
ncbi:SCL-interrupting locus protein-like [Palaemon carinicauda]|uniref:SCL-interrupting locus protein-like n=1 Tax=Palaemon carinicauda TaxID=392227 RepID=UPI0035B694B1